MEDDINDQLVLVSGESGTGKSASLRSIPNQDRWIYANCEAGKKLPFPNKFKTSKITDPWMIYDLFDWAMDPENADNVDGIIIDTITFMMDMFESLYVIPAAGTSAGQKAWGDYAQFWKNLLHQKIAKFGKPVILLGHTRRELDEAQGIYVSQVPVKGSLKNQGLEAYLTLVVSTKKVPIKVLELYGNKLLDITDEDRELGFKYVYQTKLTKETVGDRIRAPMYMWPRELTYIDNDVWKLLQHVHNFYHPA